MQSVHNFSFWAKEKRNLIVDKRNQLTWYFGPFTWLIDDAIQQQQQKSNQQQDRPMKTIQRLQTIQICQDLISQQNVQQQQQQVALNSSSSNGEHTKQTISFFFFFFFEQHITI